MKTDSLSISDRVKFIRKKYKLTQKEFAERLRVGQSTVATVERKNNVSDQFVYILSNEFGIEEEWIRTGKGNMKKSPEEMVKEIINKLPPEEVMEALNNLFKKDAKVYYNLVRDEEVVYNLIEEKDKPEFYKVLDFLKRKYEDADQDMKGWLTVEIKKNFPEYEEYVKKNQPEQKNA
jgi:transcriptional regulator with XRE-family HTH domain